MKQVFRIGFFLIPFLFLVSTTAYPAEGQAKRSPSSVTQFQKMDLSRLSAWNRSKPNLSKPSHQVQMASGLQPVTPPIGRGMGVAAPVLRFQ